MSADLLAEFDSFYKDSGSSNSAPQKDSQDSWGQFETVSAPQKAVAAAPAQDPWDFFGSAEPTQQQPQSISPPLNQNTSAATQPGPAVRPPQVVRASTFELFSNNIATIAEAQARETAANPGSSSWFSVETKPSKPESSGGEVLFDATEELFDEPEGNEDDDEFGDFEEAPSSKAPPPPSVTPLSLQSITSKSPSNPSAGSLTFSPSTLSPPITTSTREVPNFPYPQAPKSPSFQERNPFSGIAVSTASKSSAAQEKEPKTDSPVTAWPSFAPKKPTLTPYQDSPASFKGKDDDWGDWADLPPESTTVSRSNTQDDWGWDSFDTAPAPKTTSMPEPEPQGPPPTNVPPPSILLSMFTQLFETPQSHLFQPVANQPFPLKNRILSDPSTIKFLQGYVKLASVAAHIIAGRKLRWKRDTILAQSMRIGPAAAGGKGGMKLTGVDKSETMREDREAADVVRVWKEQLGRLRSAVSTANASMQDAAEHIVIPEISETMPVKETQGALKAPKPCVICGIKRDERVPKVDVDVEDSFGEWWVEHWGHRTCKNFWQEHEQKLRQR